MDIRVKESIEVWDKVCSELGLHAKISERTTQEIHSGLSLLAPWVCSNEGTLHDKLVGWFNQAACTSNTPAQRRELMMGLLCYMEKTVIPLGRALISANIPKKLMDENIDSFIADSDRAKEIHDLVKRNMDSSFLFYGPPGVGKGHMAVSIMKNTLLNKMGEYIHEDGFYQDNMAPLGKQVYYTTARNMFLGINRHLYSDTEDCSVGVSIEEQIYDVKTLVIDELARTKNSEAEMGTLFDVVDSRINDGKQTILISNFSQKELGGIFKDAAFIDRLRCDFIPVNFNLSSHRATKEVR